MMVMVMKIALRILLPILLSLAILLCLAWYLLIYDTAFSRDLLLTGARLSDNSGNSTLSAWFYNQAYKLAENSSDSRESVAIELAEQYKRSGNYTKAEYTLTKAISDGGGINVYVALCKTYVEQNKLYNAVALLDGVTNQSIKKELDSLRPAAPVNTPDPGFYNQYISVTFEAKSGTIYASVGSKYPSLEDKPYSAPISLSDGENTVSALAVSKDGLVSSLTTCSYTIGGVVKEIAFSDRFIEATIRDLLDADKKQLYTNDLWKITEFTVPAGASDYSDLLHIKNVKSFTVEKGNPKELSCLSAMTELTSLTIRDTEITAEVLEIIGTLTKLENLTIQNCKLSNIAPFKKLTAVTHLDLSGNSVYDLSPLSGMTKLKELNLKSNVIADLSALSNLKSLTKLDVSQNNIITSLAPLSSLEKLEWLDASINSITELGNIGNLKALRYLSLATNKLTNISPVATCDSLTDLNFSQNRVSDISKLSALPHLMYLRFEGNQVTQLPGFAEDCELVIIDGTGNNIKSLEPLKGLPYLNNVYMNNNPELSSVSPLASCHMLIEVHVDKTKVTDVSALKDMDVIVRYTPI